MMKEQSNGVATLTVSVSGMTCGGCAKTVERVLSQVPGVTDVTVDLASGSAVIGGKAAADEIIAALEAAGYGAEVAPRVLSEAAGR